MAMRLTGMNSGLDTESIIQELVAVRQKKVDNTKKEQKKLEWKQEAWKDLNTKLKSFQNKYVSNMRLSADYAKKTTKVSNSNIANVITSENAVNSVQTLRVERLAKTAYLTGGKLAGSDAGKLNALTKLSDITGSTVEGEGTITLTTGTGSSAKSVDITVNENTTISDVLTQLKDNGLNASFDEKQGRLFVSAKKSGEASDFTLTSSDANGLAALSALKLTEDAGATKVDGSNAKIWLNDAEFTSDTNVFQINGLTITALQQTKAGEEVTLTTENDTSGIYDMIKNLFKEYNELINSMDKLYNDDSGKDYDPLSEEEEYSMSEKKVEDWEQKIKDSLLYRDENLSDISTALKDVMSSGFTVNGKTMYLSDFGIATLGYFSAEKYERNAYHIDGDADDENTSTATNKLKEMITNNPDTVVSFFSQLSQKLYDKMFDMSKSVNGYRSYGNFYDDKKLTSDYTSYTSKIADLEEKLFAYEDKWYKKFAEMETAMAKMQSNSTAVTNMLGGL
ncbi:MAG: flagellar filament capping protein FliD [Lachnospiraceae bacterium]|nr:flagellar filament capping protein FliD [Lachnospiraceae bacterium]